MFKRIATITALAAVAIPVAVSASTPPSESDVYEVEGAIHRTVPEICELVEALADNGLADYQMTHRIVSEYVDLFDHLDAADRSRSSAYIRGVIAGCAYTQ